MGRTGFDWDNAFGAETIARVMGNNPEIALEASIQTELYRVDRYKRVDRAERKGIPQISVAEVRAQIAPEVSRCIVWNGAVARRSAVIKSERRSQIPILMYHRVAVDGPAELARFRLPPTVFREQMLWLRRNGYHGIDSEQLAWFVERQHPFVGRPVLITFDDGYRDFADAAWPILQENDFTAELFVVSKLVGKCAEWDAPLEDAAPLLGVSELVRLAREGVKIGSHLATHPRSDELSAEELAEELLGSRAQLEKWLRRPVMSLAAPYGCVDQRFGVLAAECGYRTVFNTANKVASISDDLFDLPRLEIQGNLTIEAFANCMMSFQ
jgi:peptidoglycan/xylan/chitin deacetylase (PgdA/CDA1 family)